MSGTAGIQTIVAELEAQRAAVAGALGTRAVNYAIRIADLEGQLEAMAKDLEAAQAERAKLEAVVASLNATGGKA